MGETMKAMVLEAPRQLVYRDVPLPDPGPRGILFKVSYAAICGTDVSIYKEGRFVQGLPLIIGHEFCGHVVSVGPEVRGIEVGERVMGCNVHPCGECERCKSGNEWTCLEINKHLLGLGDNGVFAEYGAITNAIPGATVHKIPDGLNDLEAALCEPMCVGVGNVANVQPQSGDKIVIYGAGMIGQSFLQACKLTPDVQVAVVDLSDFRLELARQSGADVLVNPAKEGRAAVEVLMDLWGPGHYPYHYEGRVGGSADVVIECTGSMACVAECFSMAGNKGKICLAGSYGDDQVAEFHPSYFFYKGLRLFDGRAGNFAKSVELMGDGTFKTRHIITDVYPLEELDAAFQRAMTTERSLKVCVKVDPDVPDYPYNQQD